MCPGCHLQQRARLQGASTKVCTVPVCPSRLGTASAPTLSCALGLGCLVSYTKPMPPPTCPFQQVQWMPGSGVRPRAPNPSPVRGATRPPQSPTARCLASPCSCLLSSQFRSICHLSRSKQLKPSLLLRFRNSAGLSPSCLPPPLPHAELACSVRGLTLVRTDGLGCIWYLLALLPGLCKDSGATSCCGHPPQAMALLRPQSLPLLLSLLMHQTQCPGVGAPAWSSLLRPQGTSWGLQPSAPPPSSLQPLTLVLPVPLAECWAPAGTHCPMRSSCTEPWLLRRAGSCASVRGDAQVPRGCGEPDVGPQVRAWPWEHEGGGRGHSPSPPHAGTASAPSAALPSTPCPTPALPIGLGSATENVKGQILS